MSAVTIRLGDKVRVLRDITRREGPYAKAGEEGRVEDIFNSPTVGVPSERRLYAKVRIGADLKTLRLTSIERIDR